MSAVTEFHKSHFIFALLGQFSSFELGLTCQFVHFPFQFKGRKKKYSIGKLGYASVHAEISRKWNSTTAEVARGWTKPFSNWS